MNVMNQADKVNQVCRHVKKGNLNAAQSSSCPGALYYCFHCLCTGVAIMNQATSTGT